MTYSNVYQPCDHVTVHLTDATKQNAKGRFSWTLPADNNKPYFSNQRGSICTIELIAGAVTGFENVRVVSAFLVGSSANGFSVPKYTVANNNNNVTENISNACLGIAGDIGNAGRQFKSSGELLIGARPDVLTIELLVLRGVDPAAAINPVAGVAGSLTFKFTYYDAVASAVSLHDHQNYKTL